MRTTLALWLVALLFTAFAFVANREEPSEPVTVIASRATTEVTAWPVETIPDLGPRFGELVSAVKRGKVKHPLRQGYRAATGPQGVFPTDELLYKLAMCETGGTMDQHATSDTNPPYLSFFQWEIGTWHSVGGQGDPRDVPYEVQAPLARRLIMRSGWGQFPVCSRRIGAR